MFEDYSWPTAVVLIVLILAIAGYEIHHSHYVSVKAIEAGLEQDKYGKWVHPVISPPVSQGYGGSPGHLTPNEVEALRTKE
jgi:hypothetical protein